MKKNLLLLFFVLSSLFCIDAFSQTYCVPGGPITTGDSEILNVFLSGDNYDISNLNPTICSGAPTDFTATDSADVSVGTTYSLDITFGDCDGGSLFSGTGKAWIDWNNDGDFLDSLEELGTWAGTPANSGTTTYNANFNFVVPSFAVLGATRMRVMQREGGTLANTTPCATGWLYGGVEDYTIRVTNTPPPCPKPTAVHISNTTATTATLSFISNGISFPVEYGPVGFTQGTGAIDTANTTGHVITGLTGATSYDLYVLNDCSGSSNGLSTWVGPITFSTLVCDTSDQCLYEVILTDDYGDGWNGALVGVYQNGVLVTQIGSTFINGLLDTVYVSLCDSLPTEFVLDVSGLYSYEIGFEVINPFGLTEILVLPPGGFVGPVAGFSFGTFNSSCTAPLCPQSSNFAAANITTNSADITWTGGGIGTAWRVEYGPAGFLPGTGGATMANTAMTSLSLSGLAPATNYEMYIQDSCDITISSNWVGPFSFSTLVCDTVDQCLYTVIMEDDFGDGWNGGLIGVYQGGVRVAQIGGAFATGYWDTAYVSLCDSVFTEFILDNPGGYSEEMGIEVINPFGLSVLTTLPYFSPQIPILGDSFGSITSNCTPPACPDPTNLVASNLTGFSAQIDWSAFGSNHLEFAVEYGLQGFSQGTGISTIDTVSNTTISLSGLLPVTCYDVYVMGLCGSANGNSSWVGPITFCTLVSCPAPSAVSASNITTTSADLSWTTGSASNWNYVYGPAGTTPATGTVLNASSNAVSLTGLQSSSTYDFWVRDSCGLGDVSTWAGPYSFSTACNTASMPYLLTFVNWPAPCVNLVGGTGFDWDSYAPNAAYADFWSNTSGEAWMQTNQVLINAPAEIVYEWSRNSTTFYNDTLHILVKDITSTTWDTIYTATGTALESNDGAGNTTPGSYVTNTVAVPLALVGSTIDVLFVGVSDWGPNLFIKSIKVQEPGTCPSPMNEMAQNITCDALDISWVSDAGTVVSGMVWGATGFDPLVAGTIVPSASSPQSITGLTPGTAYDFYIVDSCSTGVSLPVLVTASTVSAPLPTLSFTSMQGTTTATTADWTFDASASTDYTNVKWEFGDGSADGTNATETHVYNANQPFTVTVTLTNSCGAVDSTFTANVQGISIEESELGRSLNIFPNPSLGNLNVNFYVTTPQNVTLAVTNIVGAKVALKNLGKVDGEQNVQLDLSKNASGIYLVQIVTEGGTITKRVTLTTK